MNIGKYEREKFLTVNENLRDEEKRIQRENKEKEFILFTITIFNDFGGDLISQSKEQFQKICEELDKIKKKLIE